VIILTRLNGRELAVNPDLIERAESTPDTVVTLSDGTKLLVAESLLELVTRVRHWRATVAAEAYQLAGVRDLTLDEDGSDEVAPAAHSNDRSDSTTETAEVSAAEVTAHTLLTPTLARVLRLPRREG
jgi:flagellar protein FlbD